MKTPSRIRFSLFVSCAISGVVALVAFGILRDVNSEVRRRETLNEIAEKTRALQILTASFKEESTQSAVLQIKEVLRSLDRLLQTVSARTPREEGLIAQLRKSYNELGPLIDRCSIPGRPPSDREKERRDILASQIWMKVQFISDDRKRLDDISQSRILAAHQKTGVTIVILFLLLAMTNGVIYALSVRSILRSQRALLENQRRLQESREDLSRAQAVAHVGSWRLDMRRNELTWSDESYRIAGIPEGTPLTYESFLAIVHPEDREYVDRKWKTALQGQPYDIEHRMIVNGEIRWAREQAQLEFDAHGQLLGGFGALHDITKRKQAERRLFASYTVTRILAESPALNTAIPDVLQAIGEGLCWHVGDMWSLDSESNVLRCRNVWSIPSMDIEAFKTASCALTLPPGSSLPGRVWGSLEPVCVSDVGKDANFVRAPEASAVGLRSAFAFPITAGGKFLGVMEFFSLEVRQPDDSLLEMLTGIGSQIGQFIERKKVEDALFKAHELLADRAIHLESLVKERTAKLQEMVNELQHVSYSIAHDMRAPLRAMNTFAGLLSQDGNGSMTPAQRQEYSRRIIVAAGRLDGLIQDALHYTKIAQQETSLGPVELGNLLREIVATYPNLHADKADIFIEGELPVVLGNDSLLTQCFSNLLGNAVKFVAPGVRPEVHVRAESRDGTAKIWIQDNGIGIPKNAHPRLFGMFQKIDAHYEGTGIGLAIVRKVAQRMGGKVGVESEPGSGSRFWVELPVANRGKHERMAKE